MCKQAIRTKGLDNVTVEDLLQELTPRGRALVPEAVKNELLVRIRRFLESGDE
jgi:enhancer of yellow 2 transcription factor